MNQQRFSTVSNFTDWATSRGRQGSQPDQWLCAGMHTSPGAADGWKRR